MTPIGLLHLSLVLFAIRYCSADLPVHCLPEDVLGDWTFVADDAPVEGSVPRCGHSTPNSALSALSLVGEAPRKQYVVEKERFNVTLTNQVDDSGERPALLAIGPDGEKGTWTMVFDEGFEVRLAGGKSYFAHFEFETMPGQQGHNGDMLDKIGAFYGRVDGHVLRAFPEPVYACHCERTTIGWHSHPASSGVGERHGCFHAHREGTPTIGFIQRHQVPTSVVSMGEANGKKTILVHMPRSKGALRGAANATGLKMETLPLNWDWRDQPGLEQEGDDLASEFDQGACGSCYAFSGTVALGMRFRIALAKKLGRPTSLDLSWRATARCAPWNEGCGGGFPFLVGRQAKEMGLFQLTTSLATEPKCNADLASLSLEAECPLSCQNPDSSAQPVYYAADYGYIGGFAQGATEQAIMRDLYEHGPLSIELSVKAIPMLFSGNDGEVITTYNNRAPHRDDVPQHAVDERLAHLSPERNQTLASLPGKPFDFKDWLWVDHALLSVGWGEDQSKDLHQKKATIVGTPVSLGLLQQRLPDMIHHWIIRNSWGPDWAKNGYGKLIRGVNAGGIEISAVWMTPDMQRLPKDFDIPAAKPEH